MSVIQYNNEKYSLDYVAPFTGVKDALHATLNTEDKKKQLLEQVTTVRT